MYSPEFQEAPDCNPDPDRHEWTDEEIEELFAEPTTSEATEELYNRG